MHNIWKPLVWAALIIAIASIAKSGAIGSNLAKLLLVIIPALAALHIYRGMHCCQHDQEA